MDSELLKKTYPYQKLIVENIKFVSRALKYATRDMINFAKEAYEWLADFKLGIKQADSVATFRMDESEERIKRIQKRIKHYHQLQISRNIETREIELSKEFINTTISVK